MFGLVLLLVTLNLPVAFALAHWLDLRSFWRLLLLGVVQYAASAVLTATVIAWSEPDAIPPLAGTGMLVLALPAAPFVVATAAGIRWFRTREPGDARPGT